MFILLSFHFLKGWVIQGNDWASCGAEFLTCGSHMQGMHSNPLTIALTVHLFTPERGDNYISQTPLPALVR